MRIGIYGGSFNPFHIGHEKISLEAIKLLNLDKLIIVPVGIPSHRENNLEDSNIRLDIINKIFSDNKKIFVSDIEINSDEKSYTYDTLLKLKNIYGKENIYFEIIGEDSLENFNNWKNYEKILEEAYLCVVKRKINNKKDNIFKSDKIIFLDMEYIDISASEVRRRIKQNLDISDLVNNKVKDLILKEMIDNV